MEDDIVIRPLRGAREFHECVRLQEATWGEGFSERVPSAILWAAQRVGGVTSGAFDPDGRMIGFVFGLTGVEGERRVHWSDMLAVVPEHRDCGIGVRLKRHQRELLLQRGVERVYWTFDPLESKNAYVNFSRLGITAREYHVNLYRLSDSPLHQGIGTDRLVAIWEIGSERVRSRLDRPDAVTDAYRAAPLVNPPDVVEGTPHSTPPELGLDGEAVRIAIPASIQDLKDAHPGLAAAWREHTRAAFLEYLSRGWEVTGLVRPSEVWSAYLLEWRTALAR